MRWFFSLCGCQDKNDSQTYWLAFIGRPIDQERKAFQWENGGRVYLNACGRHRTLTMLQKVVDRHWETSQKKCQRGIRQQCKVKQDVLNEAKANNTAHFPHIDGPLLSETRRIDGIPSKNRGINNPLDATLRMEGSRASTLCDIVIDVPEPPASRARGDPSRQLKHKNTRNHTGIHWHGNTKHNMCITSLSMKHAASAAVQIFN